jgi:hypothetical protein
MAEKQEQHKTYLDKSADNAGLTVPDYAINQAILAMSKALCGCDGKAVLPNSDDGQDLYKAIQDLCEAQQY